MSNPGFLTRLIAKSAAGLFGFTSGVVRNARTFHPDGRTFLGAVRSLEPADPSYARAAGRLQGATLMRIGMGVMKRGAPVWLAKIIPDAPSISARIYTASSPQEIRIEHIPEEDLDLLCTAGGDRLSKLAFNLATGGRLFGLNPFDYFQNFYYADVPYSIDEGKSNVWIRIAPIPYPGQGKSKTPRDPEFREQGLTSAVNERKVMHIEFQPVGGNKAAFVPVAEIQFLKEIEVDQEALHFDPIAGRDFRPGGFYTALREKVYPASYRKRPHNRAQRASRQKEGILRRSIRYLSRKG